MVKALAITTLKWASRFEVVDFDVVILVEEDVLRLEVSVSKAAVVDVLDTLEHL